MSAEADKTMLARRARVLAPTYQLFYDEPVEFVRASDVWLYDRAGHAYLDAYNNVPVVGHCHPYVVDELARQAATLNTHTRYLAEQPLELAETLLATMPGELGRVVFTCTGSEANDLAVRVSKAVTGGTGFIVTEFAYHGVTDVLAGMSPEDGGRVGPGVYTVAPPQEGEEVTAFADRVRQCLERMRSDGVRPAALLVDTIFSSEGVVANPQGLLAEAARVMRAAGGLFIADEVQPGFGRLGETMWGFARHGVVPDIVTMGKPMGNGHPVAALVARPQVLTAFAASTRYFNTFGGNNVSCAVALAVLKVIREEKLLENALRSGEYLRRGLEELATRRPVLQEVRGAGLFLGVELVPERGEKMSGAAIAARIVNGMRRRGVLISATSRAGNVLKIRPPLTFEIEHADLLLDALARAIDEELGAGG